MLLGTAWQESREDKKDFKKCSHAISQASWGGLRLGLHWRLLALLSSTILDLSPSSFLRFSLFLQGPLFRQESKSRNLCSCLSYIRNECICSWLCVVRSLLKRVPPGWMSQQWTQAKRVSLLTTCITRKVVNKRWSPFPFNRKREKLTSYRLWEKE
jgi:hypothetical protein